MCFCGLYLIFLILRQLAPLRYSFPFSTIVWLSMVSIRYFFFFLYYSVYLGSLYSQESWYRTGLVIISFFFTMLGIMLIIFLFDGSTLKLLLVFFCMEMVTTITFSACILLLDLFFQNTPSLSYTKGSSLHDFLLIPITVALYYLLTTFGKRFFNLYRNWEVRNITGLAVAEALYLIIGIGSTTNFAIGHGDRGSLIMVLCTLLCLITMFFTWFRELNKKAFQTRIELEGLESAMAVRYEQILEHSAKLESHHRHIEEKADGLIRKIIEENEKWGNLASQAGTEADQDYHHDIETIESYLHQLNEWYHELSVSSYCQDPVINQALTDCVQPLEKEGITVTVMFSEYHPLSGILQTDVADLIRFMGQKRNGLKTLVLQSGTIGNELLLVCLASPARRPRIPRHIKKILRRLKADYQIEDNLDGYKMIIAISAS